MKKFLFIFYLSFFIFHLLPISAYAASKNFKTSYDATYTIREDGTTNVVFKIILTNLTSQYYASSYKLIAAFSKIYNVEASDPNGKLVPKTSKTDAGHSIEIVFNKKAVGISDNLPFSISFDTKEIAQKQGNVWEINIPGIDNQDSFENFTVHVKTPSSFGTPSYIKPRPTSPASELAGGQAKPKTNSLDFTKEVLGKSGITLSFGDTQYYAFVLTYHLSNKHLFPIETEIAFPPSTNYQDVVIDKISQKPTRITIDRDGNYLGKYSLSPSEKFDVKVWGRTKVSLYPKKEMLLKADGEVYQKPKPYWENDQKIKDLAKKLKTPEAIYDYVVKSLSYDFTRVTGNSPRLGAKAVLENPHSAVCLEFTDLFIALSRAAGIPAREVDGFAYTQNQRQRPLSGVADVLHAWPEYYDRKKQTWIMVDPTWGNTTGGLDYFFILDTNHLSFAKRGISSIYPIPAGGYKPEGFENAKDVKVTFTKRFDPQTSENVLSDLPKKPSPTTITISNLLTNGTIILIIATGIWCLLFFRRKR